LYPRAIEAWQQAGAHALARVAYREAASSIECALDALQQLPASQQSPELAIDLRLMSRNAHFPLADHDRVLERLREAEAIAEQVGDQWRLGQILTRMSLSFFSVPALDRAIETGQRALAIANSHAYGDIHSIASIYLSGCNQALGNYQRAIDLATPIVHCLVGDLAYEFYGLEVTPAVTGRGLLAVSLSEIGRFSDAMLYVEEAIRIADELDHPRTQTTAYLLAGIILLRRGHMARALPLLEQAVKICRDANITVRFAAAAAALSCAYAHTGQVELAHQLLDEFSWPTVSMGFPVLSHMVEAPLITEIPSAYKFAMRSLDMARDQNARGEQAHVLRLLGDHHRRHGADDVDRAESSYRQALSTAQELGMRPLQAHCHLGLGTLYSERGEQALARQELSKAQALYRDMEMTFWIPSVEAALSQVEGL
jgi:tetratricopeptide (TPR) repeat protein